MLPLHDLPPHQPDTPFALLENTRDTAAPARLYLQPVAEVIAHQALELESAIELLALHSRQGKHLCGYLSYEAGVLLARLPVSKTGLTPLLHFYVYDRVTLIDSATCHALLAQWAKNDTACAIHSASLAEDANAYAAKLSRIQQAITNGETYQINYTLPYTFGYSGSTAGLYQALRATQRVDYSAWFAFQEAEVLSLSPELFIRKEGNTLITKPMKGTARRGENDAEDMAISTALKADSKTRAENLMIVDLLRNDLGRIAETGSVKVTSLFEVERYETLHQMTSTIQCQLGSNRSLLDMLRSLFPCGSITGAPKYQSMKLINELESSARGIYTGAIGYIEPAASGAAIGNFCFNVPIRTLVSTQPGLATMGVGSGIVADSNPVDEYAEVLLKTRFLHGVNQGLTILESMRAEAGQISLLESHLARLKSSAQTFGFVFNEALIREQLNDYLNNLGQMSEPCRLRLSLNANGQASLSHYPIIKPTGEPFVVMSQTTIQSNSIFRRHKTSQRDDYETAYAQATADGAYEVLFLNEHGRVAEAARHNVFIEKSVRLLTPPVAEGALPGVLRQSLLTGPKRHCHECPLSLDDLKTADAIYVGNAVRGLVKVKLKTN